MALERKVLGAGRVSTASWENAVAREASSHRLVVCPGGRGAGVTHNFWPQRGRLAIFKPCSRCHVAVVGCRAIPTPSIDSPDEGVGAIALTLATCHFTAGVAHDRAAVTKTIPKAIAETITQAAAEPVRGATEPMGLQLLHRFGHT